MPASVSAERWAGFLASLLVVLHTAPARAAAQPAEAPPPRHVVSPRASGGDVQSSPDDIYWSTNFASPGFYYEIRAMAVYNNELIVGGAVSFIDGQPIDGIARWTGIGWMPLGSGIRGDSFYAYNVTALTVLGTDLIVSGEFDSAGGVPAPGIARWNGSSWSAMGSGPYGANAFASFGGSLYAGDYSGLHRWTGSAWVTVLSGEVDDLAIWNSQLVAVGRLTVNAVSGVPVAAYNGSAWSALASSTNSTPATVAAYGGDLYIAGMFTRVDGVVTIGVARWDGAAWRGTGLSFLGGPPLDADLEVYAGRLYLVGALTTPQGKGIVSWDGVGWSSPAGGVTSLDAWPGCALPWQGSLVVGGHFGGAGSVGAWGLAIWNGSVWSALGTRHLDAVDGYIYDFATWNGQLVAAGVLFATGDIAPAGGVALLDGAQWSGFTDAPGRADGTAPTVYTLAPAGTNLLIGGTFDQYHGAPLAHVARWDGSAWQGYGAGLNGTVRTLTFYEGQPVAGGEFTASGANPVTRVARWDGSTWSPLGAGFNGTVFALLVHGGRLYAAGGFTASGATPLAHIAAWDGSAWGPVGTGVSGTVYALASYAGQLVATGWFYVASGVSASRIASWDGTSWAPLGSGLTGDWDYEGGFGQDLLPFSGSLYAVGHFLFAGGIRSPCIARWDGAQWHALGSAIPLGNSTLGPTAYAVGALGTQVYVGGNFMQVAGKPSIGIARWEEPIASGVPETPLPIAELTAWPNPGRGVVTLRVALRQSDTVTLEIIDVQGRRVRRVASQALMEGDHLLAWDGRDDAGREVVPGVYLARLATRLGTTTTRVVRVR